MKKNNKKVAAPSKVSREDNLHLTVLQMQMNELQRQAQVIKFQQTQVLRKYGVNEGEHVFIEEDGTIRRAGPRAIVPQVNPQPTTKKESA